jgi:hypothetical protein
VTAYKSYADKKTTPSRMARKRARGDVFRFNRSSAKAERKARRLARRQAQEEA